MTKSFAAALTAGALLAGASMARSEAGSTGPAVFTNAQATAGAKTYSAQCSKCHGASLEGISAPALRGTGSGLAGDSVSEAYTFISTQMPAGNPGSLSAKDYADVMAFILSRNGHAPGPTPLTSDTAKKSQLKV